MVIEVNLIAEVKAALVEVIEVPVALLKLKSEEALRLVVVTLVTTMLVPVIEVKLALVLVRLLTTPLVLVKLVKTPVLGVVRPMVVPLIEPPVIATPLAF